MKNEKGFSLIELMIVVVIIGILSTIAVPQYQRFQAKAKQAEAKANLSGVYTAMQAFNAEWNRYYGDFNAIGYQAAGDLQYDVGFAAAGPAGPMQHPNTAYRNVAPTVFRATQVCANNANANAVCRMKGNTAAERGLVTRVATATINAAANQFIAGADGNLDADAQTDQWTINHTKQVNNLINDIQ